MRRIVVTLLLIAALVAPVIALNNNFNNYDPGWVGVYRHFYQGDLVSELALTPMAAPYDDCHVVPWLWAPVPLAGGATNYISFSVANPAPVNEPYLALSANGYRDDLTLWLSEGDNAGGYILNLTPAARVTPYNYRVQVYRQNGDYLFYVGDVLVDDDEGDNSIHFPSFIAGSGGWSSGVSVDDYSTLPATDTMVGVFPSTWFVTKDIANPLLSGVYRAPLDDFSNSFFHATYALADWEPGWTLSIDEGAYCVTALPQWVDGATVKDVNGVWQPVEKKCGLVTMNLTAADFFNTAEYGLHTVDLMDGSTVVTSASFWYKAVATSETWIEFDRDMYAPGDAINIRSHIGSNYIGAGGIASYRGELWDPTMGTKVAEWTAGVDHTYSTFTESALFPASGEYTAVLYGETQSGDVMLDADTAYIYNNKIILCGNVYNAESGTPLQGATVDFTQGTLNKTVTTNDTGWFEIGGIEKDTTATIVYSKTGFQTFTAIDTFPEYKRYYVEVALLPTSVTHTGCAIAGVVYGLPYNSTVAGATVKLYDDDTLVQTTTSTATGFYLFNNTLSGHSYHLEVDATGWKHTEDAVTTAASDTGIVYKNIFMLPEMSVTLHYIDSVTRAPITSLLVCSLSNADNKETTTGTVAWSDVTAGEHAFGVAGSGYTGTEGTLYVDGAVNETIALVAAAPVTTPATTAPTATATPSVVTVHGKVYDVWNMTAIAGADVTLVQNGVTRHATSGGDGSYSFANAVYNAATTMNAAKAGYHHTAFTFTTFGYADFPVDLYMTSDGGKPGDWTIEPGRAGVAGYVVGGVYKQFLPEAAVTISNDTWSCTPHRDANGNFWLGNLTPNSAYSATGTQTGYVTKTVPFMTGNADGWVDVEVWLAQVFSVTVHCHDADKIADYITLVSCRVECSSGVTKNTTGGIATFPNLQYGTYTWTASATGYSTNGAQEIVYKDGQVVDIFLQKTTDTGSEISYSVPPHNVRFITQDFMAVPIAGVGVSAIGTTTTVPDRGIFDAIFGWTDKYTNSSLTDTAMHDTTASDGSVVFLMTELMKYRVTFTPPGGGANQTIDIYPQESVYIITMGDRPFEGSVAAAVNATAWADAPEGADATLHVAYDDPAGRTAWSRFIVKNGTGAEIHNATFTGTASFPVAHVSGASYVWGVVASHQDHGRIEKWNGITLHSRLIDLGLEEVYYVWISIAAIIMFTAIFSGSNSKYGYVLVPLFAGILWWIGWMPVSFLVWSSMLAVGVIAYFTRAQGV